MLYITHGMLRLPEAAPWNRAAKSGVLPHLPQKRTCILEAQHEAVPLCIVDACAQQTAVGQEDHHFKMRYSCACA